MKKSKLFAWLCALCPGAGPMYLGLMKMGTILTAAFCGVIFIAFILRMEEVLFALPLVWLYSFFTTINNISNSKEDNEELQKSFLNEFSLISTKNFFKTLAGKGGLLWGWGCIALGFYLLSDALYYPVLRPLFDRFYIIGALWYSLPSLALSFALFFLGYYFLQGGKKKPANNEDIVAFKEAEGGEKNV